MIPSFKAFVIESMMGDTGIEPHIPADFEEMHSYTDQHGWSKLYRFKGKDGGTRHLSITILNHDNGYHSVTFGVMGKDPAEENRLPRPEDEDPEVVHQRNLAHGRGPEVMSAVAHVLKKHVEEHDPVTINFAPTSKSRGRLYGSMFRRITKGGHYQKGNSIHKWPAF